MPSERATEGAEAELDSNEQSLAAEVIDLVNHSHADKSKASSGILELLRQTIERDASDIHLKPGSPPTVRQSGALEALQDAPLGASECAEMADALMSEEDRRTLAEHGEVDFACTTSDLGRFRINIHRQRGGVGIAARRIVDDIPNFEELGLPPVVEKLAGGHRGLVLVTGPTSSGKTTTCGAIIKHINQTRACHIVTIEDPIEIVHNDQKAIVTQREVGNDTGSFDRALRAAMRQDPDVIFVGEIRDHETIKAALQAAETGHLVIATMHTTDCIETISRIVDFFPPDHQKQVRSTLAGSLAGVITQRLLPKVGGGRVPAVEAMVTNGRVTDCIMDSDKTLELMDIIAESGFYGMQTFDQALISLYKEGLVTLEDARDAADRPQDFELELKKDGMLAL